MKMPPELCHTAAVMRAELESTRLTVALAPYQRGRAGNSIRVVEQRNPAWYSRFCAAYPSSRKRSRKKPDTRIRRANTLRALAELERGKMASEYAARLFPVVCEEYLKHWRPDAPAALAKSGEAAARPIYL